MSGTRKWSRPAPSASTRSNAHRAGRSPRAEPAGDPLSSHGTPGLGRRDRARAAAAGAPALHRSLRPGALTGPPAGAGTLVSDRGPVRGRLPADPGGAAVPLRLVRRLRPATRLRPVERELRALARRLGQGRRDRRGVRRASPLDSLPPAPRQPPPMVAVDRTPHRAAHRARDDRAAALDRAAVRPIRPDAGPGTGDADPRAGGAGRNPGEPDLRGRRRATRLAW